MGTFTAHSITRTTGTASRKEKAKEKTKEEEKDTKERTTHTLGTSTAVH